MSTTFETTREKKIQNISEPLIRFEVLKNLGITKDEKFNKFQKNLGTKNFETIDDENFKNSNKFGNH